MTKNNWNKAGTQKRAGILAPLFSVYSKDSIGIGDFDDLKLLIEFCHKSGCSILQLLPMNETGSTFCPYDAVSSFALEPMYISLVALPGASDKTIQAKIEAARKANPSGQKHVDYKIKDEKIKLLRHIYSAQGAGDAKDLKKFSDHNAYWLDDFALFKVLKEFHKGKPWYEWEERYKEHDGRELAIFAKKHGKEVDFQKWSQWVAYRQFAEARSCAGSKNVLMCGDLPILISRDSADVWSHPEFFNLDFAAGAPPDMYCAKGQRWGMPTYDWDKISADSYTYLKEKLKFAENFYDILRVDHVVGLFRIWSIPYNDPQENEGLNGVFDPSDEHLWKEHGVSILSVMCGNTRMLLCAEDLGMIPKACPETLKEFAIPGNEVQRWTKDWVKTHDFLDPEEYREMSVAMLSTHDTTNWAAWWENEAGTVDQPLFIRKSLDRNIDYSAAQDRLFDPVRSKHGRLRWLDSIRSVDLLVGILGKRPEELRDFIEMYENTYEEKEKLWQRFKLKGSMKEKSSPDTIAAALKITLSSRSIFCIELIMDYLNMAGLYKGDLYAYRVNRPGTISKDNWSLTIPLSR
ncbi:MAG: 4-alpha-glucanotransferase, partial [Candidatus Omnitrophica bacterium]|nr:4-alpha-glucanotransferase [Candidatus Omnitrophota bacterium]